MFREMWLGLKRFWGLRWLIKVPILAGLGFVILVIVVAIVGGEEEEEGAQVAAEATSELTTPPSTPSPTSEMMLTPEPTDEPATEPQHFVAVTSHPSGSEICALDPTITVVGAALPGAGVKHGDQETTADSAGRWTMEVRLDEGENKLKFEIVDESDAKHEIQLIYCLPANADKAKGILVVLNEISDPFQSSDLLCEAEAGNRLVTVNVTVINTNDDTKGIRDYNFEVRDSNGVQWEPFLFSCASPTLGSLDLSSGGQIDGWITFEVRANSQLVEVYYDPDTFSTDDVHIPIP